MTLYWSYFTATTIARYQMQKLSFVRANRGQTHMALYTPLGKKLTRKLLSMYLCIYEVSVYWGVCVLSVCLWIRSIQSVPDSNLTFSSGGGLGMGISKTDKFKFHNIRRYNTRMDFMRNASIFYTAQWPDSIFRNSYSYRCVLLVDESEEKAGSPVSWFVRPETATLSREFGRFSEGKGSSPPAVWRILQTIRQIVFGLFYRQTLPGCGGPSAHQRDFGERFW